MPIIKAKPLQIKKQPLSEQPKLRSLSSYSKLNGLGLASKRMVELPPPFHFSEGQSVEKQDGGSGSLDVGKEMKGTDECDRVSIEESEVSV